MKRMAFFTLAALLLAACTGPTATITVTNPLNVNRAGELVEVPMTDLARRLNLPDNAQLVVLDETGHEVPTQRTHDGLLLFPATVDALQTVRYTVRPGTPAPVVAQVCGRVYPERLDDLAWENDLVAFRAYGPALQATGERGYGYDLLTKRGTDLPVLEERYALDRSPETRARIAELRKTDPAEARRLEQSISYHVDHGNGMDCYAVGPTLGGGTTALLQADGSIAYPWCYRQCEVLDNGPLRFTARLVFNPLRVDGDTAVVETRVISLDLGSHLNRTVVTYEGLSHEAPLAAGIVLHDDGDQALNAEDGYMAYADPTTGKNNGTLFVGTVFPGPVREMKAELFADVRQHAGAQGHLLAVQGYAPGTAFTYYWGFGWDRAGVQDFLAWNRYLASFAQRVRKPLSVIVE